MGKHETGYERIDRDFYPTPRWATEALLEHIDINGLHVWECAAGGGHMSEVLKAAGARVYSSDITERGYAGLDALIDYTAPHPPGLTFSGTITNPPFGEGGKLAVAFLHTALRDLGNGFCAFLLPADFDSAKTRASFFGDCPQFAGKIILRKRCKWFDTPGSASPKENHAWYLGGNIELRRSHHGNPVIRYAPQARGDQLNRFGFVA
jgi:hypothetical protein